MQVKLMIQDREISGNSVTEDNLMEEESEENLKKGMDKGREGALI